MSKRMSSDEATKVNSPMAGIRSTAGQKKKEKRKGDGMRQVARKGGEKSLNASLMHELGQLR